MLRNIKVVDELVVDLVKRLPRGHVAGDCILLTVPSLKSLIFLFSFKLGSLTGSSS